jgi:hypothetical protein
MGVRRFGGNGEKSETKKATARTKAKYRDLSTAQRTKGLSTASVEMTFFIFHFSGEAGGGCFALEREKKQIPCGDNNQAKGRG